MALFALSRKNDESLCHMMVVFKKEKESFEKIERIMTDKDFNERYVFKVKFPKTKLLLSFMSLVSKINNSKINGTHRGRKNSLPKNIIKYCI